MKRIRVSSREEEWEGIEGGGQTGNRRGTLVEYRPKRKQIAYYYLLYSRKMF